MIKLWRYKMNENNLTNEQKLILLNKDALYSQDIIFLIKREDIQTEAIDRLGRLLSDDEIICMKKSLEWAIGENMQIMYNTIFTEVLINA
jgi:hypothetical protein